jgi:hypothetical protein
MNQVVTETSLHLSNHDVYKKLNNLDNLRTFMETHVFAVWDFMSLLKRLQNDIAPTSLPWKPSPYGPKAVRLINEIVLGEESDLDQNQQPISHFELYLKAMNEVGANTDKMIYFLQDYDLSVLSPAVRDFVSFNLDLAMNASLCEVAHVFFYGREKLVPQMFDGILEVTSSIPNYQSFNYYLERHVKLDSEEHGPMALELLSTIKSEDPLKDHAKVSKALLLRKKLWDSVLEEINQKKLRRVQ